MSILAGFLRRSVANSSKKIHPAVHRAAVIEALEQRQLLTATIWREAANYSANVTASSHTWTDVGSGGVGFTDSAMQALLNNKTKIEYSAAASSASHLDYTANFSEAGKYYVWVRGLGLDGNSDSVSVGLDGVAPVTAGNIAVRQKGILWSRFSTDGAASAFVMVGSAGVHTINLYMRESGTLVDQILLTTDRTYTPVGDQPALVPDITVTADTAHNDEGGFAHKFTFKRTNAPLNNALTVKYTLGGTAMASDYSVLDGTGGAGNDRYVTFAAGSDTATVRVQATTDALIEAPETVTFTIKAGDSGNNYHGSGLVDTLYIDDKPPVATVTAGLDDAEEAGPVPQDFTFTLDQSYDKPVTLTFTIAGSATLDATATEPSDYTLTGATADSQPGIYHVTFAAHEQSKSVTVTPIPDYRTEGPETVIVTLEDGGSRSADDTTKEYTAGTAMTATIEIEDMTDGDPGMTAHTMANNAPTGDLPDSREETSGVFIPVNSDDDDYNGTPDCDQQGPVAYEDDLVPVTLNHVGSGEYHFELNDSPQHIRIWSNPDRTNEITSSDSINADEDTTVYLEGYNIGTTNLVLDWSGGGFSNVPDVDAIRVTVFEMKGQANVPELSTYSYTVEGLDPSVQGLDYALHSPGWLSAVNGVLETPYNPNNTGHAPEYISWGSGPVIGKAQYYVNPDFSWNFDVNIVHVAIGDTNQITYSPPSQLAVQTQIQGGMDATIVLEMTGPTRGTSTVQRGVKFIGAGFVQSADVIDMSGVYSDGGRHVSTLQKLTSDPDGQYSDGYQDYDSVKSFAPWMNASDPFEFSHPTVDPNVAGSSASVRLVLSQSPVFDATDQMTVGALNVDRFNLKVTYETDVYLAAINPDNSMVGGSTGIPITTQAFRSNWLFNGSGLVFSGSAYGWVKDYGAGVFGDTAFTPAYPILPPPRDNIVIAHTSSFSTAVATEGWRVNP